MHDVTEYTRHGLDWLRDWWHVFTGVILAIWWAAVRFKRNMFHDYVTIYQMNECKKDICKKIETLEAKNDAQHNQLMTALIRHIDK